MIHHVYDIVIHADHTRYSVSARAADMLTAAAAKALDLLEQPNVAEQATRLVIARRGASQLPDWEIVGPELLAACQAAIAEAPALACAGQLRAAIAKAGVRA